jgi:hypothetical protein
MAVQRRLANVRIHRRVVLETGSYHHTDEAFQTNVYHAEESAHFQAS